MPGNRFNGFSQLGIGIGLRVPHYAYILERKPKIDWFEIISENYMVGGGRALEVLEQILDLYPVAQHGVSLYFGSTDPYDPEHLRQLKSLVKRSKAPFISDHLCWGSVDGSYTHDLLPIPYTREAAKNTAERVKYVQDYLEVPVCVENVSSYAEFKLSTMSEWEFLSEVVELADCGILLDVNNIFVSSFNHGFDPFEYLEKIPHGRVGQIHIAGHTNCESFLLDTHDHAVCDDVWRLYERAIKLIGPTNTLLEWDADIPSFDQVHAEALKAKRFIEKAADEFRKATA
jgi:uncharacterized protein (UPF0276 family)